jgi:hypothetical protein
MDKKGRRSNLVGVERSVDDGSTTTAATTRMTQGTRSREWKSNVKGCKLLQKVIGSRILKDPEYPYSHYISVPFVRARAQLVRTILGNQFLFILAFFIISVPRRGPQPDLNICSLISYKMS